MIIVSLVLLFNKLLRPPRVGGRESEEAYSIWENCLGRKLAVSYMEPAGDIRSKRILDIGCGLGGKTIAYGQSGASEVIGVDISEANVLSSFRFAEKAKRSFKWAFSVGDASRLPVADGVIDTAVANDAMEHFPDPKRSVEEIARVIKQGGAIWVFFTPHFSPLGSHLYDYIYLPWCHLILRRKHIKGAIKRILEKRAGPEDSIGVEKRLKEIMRSYDEDLNHMSIKKFFKILDYFPGLQAAYVEFQPPKFQFLKFLVRIPFVRELFTGTVICRLEKTE